MGKKALERGDTSGTMVSRAWSTTAMYEGLSQILGDSATELPDDLAGLEANTQIKPQLSHNIG